MKINTYICPSDIHGLGLFAKENIPKGTEIVQDPKADLNRNRKAWLFWLKNGIKSFAYIKGYCMVNHSKKANTCRDNDFNIVASRNILKDEEITEDYYELPDTENPFENNYEETIFYIVHGRK